MGYRIFIEIFSKILSIFSMTIIIRELGISGLGLIAFISTLSGFFYPLLTLGLASGIVRYFPSIRSSSLPRLLLKKILLVVFAINLLFMTVNYWSIPRIFQSQLDQFSNKSGIAVLICIMIMIFSFENLILEYQRGIYQLNRYLIFQTVQVITLFGVAMSQTILHMTLLKFLILLLSIRCMILSLFVWVTLKFRDTEIYPSGLTAEKVPLITMRSLIQFGVPMSIAGLGNWLMGLSDRLVIAKELDLAELGVYAAINNIALVFPAATTGFFLLAYPSIISAVDDNRQELITIMRTYHKVLSFMLIPLGVLIIVSGKFLLELLISYSSNEMLIVYVLCVVASVLHQWNGLTYYILAASDKANAIRNTWVLMGLLNLFANLICVPHFGLIGAGVVNLFTFVMMDCIFFLLTKKQVGTLAFYDWRAVILSLAYTFISLLSATLLAQFIHIEKFHVIVLDFLFVLIYSCFLYGRHREEIRRAFASFDLNRK